MQRTILGLLLLAAVSGCGTQPLTVWRVSLFQGERPASCYKDGVAPADRHQTGVQIDLGSWEIYEGPEGKFFLTGATVRSAASNNLDFDQTLEGTFENDVYTFDVIDTAVVNNKPAAPTRTTTESVQTTIRFTMDGDTFDGTWSEFETYGCIGADCAAADEIEHPDCKIEHQIKGARVDADNLHVL